MILYITSWSTCNLIVCSVTKGTGRLRTSFTAATTKIICQTQLWTRIYTHLWPVRFTPSDELRMEEIIILWDIGTCHSKFLSCPLRNDFSNNCPTSLVRSLMRLTSSSLCAYIIYVHVDGYRCRRVICGSLGGP